MYNTVSLDVAKELFELGWKHETLLVYIGEPQPISRVPEYRLGFTKAYSHLANDIYAPQIHEILEVLEIHYNLGVPTVGKCNGGDEYNAYFIHWRSVWGEHKFHHLLDNNTVPMCLSENPHDAAAKLLIWCVKNNYITL